MKYSDIFKSSLDSLDHKWHECDLYLNIVCTDLEALKKNELDYDTIKKLFSFLDQKSRHFSQIELLKEKYSEFFEKYQQEKREEEKRFEEVMQKVMDDESKTMKEKYDLIMEGMLDQSDSEFNQETVESSWLDNYKDELKLKEEWIDKQALDRIDTNFSEFNGEEQIRRDIKNALTKYADLLFDFDQFYFYAGEDWDVSVDADDEYLSSSMKVDQKYEMLKYFDSLCKFRDRVNRKKVMPLA